MTMTISPQYEADAAELYGKSATQLGVSYSRADVCESSKKITLSLSYPDLLDFSKRTYFQVCDFESGSGPTESAPVPLPADPRLKAWGSDSRSETTFRVFEGTADKSKIYVEIWKAGRIVNRKFLPEARDVYNGGVFGSPAVCSTFIAFVFEASEEKYERGWWATEKLSVINKYKYTPSFGETLTKALNPKLCILDFSGKVKIIEKEGWVFAAPSICPNGRGLAVVGYRDRCKFQRPGLSVCFNREASIFWITWDLEISSFSIQELTQGIFLSLSPVFSSEGNKMIFTGKRKSFPTHCAELDMFVIERQGDCWEQPRQIELVKNEEFPGLFHVLHEESRSTRFLSDSQRFVFNSNCKGEGSVFVGDIKDGKICKLQVSGCSSSLTLLEIYSQDIGVFVTQDFLRPPEVWIARIPSANEMPSYLIDARRISTVAPDLGVLSSCQVKRVQTDHAHGWLIEHMSDSCRPLVVKIHGGPHACAMNSFSLEICTFLNAGFHGLLPNYRGSGGWGGEFLASLAGRVGIDDVHDCIEITKVGITQLGGKIDKSKVIAYGGSHGGFLTGWLLGSAEAHAIFAGGVLWNPAVDLLASNLTSDIPEWAVSCINGTNDSYLEPGDHFVTQALQRSASKVAANVKAPSLVVLGGADLRVNAMAGLRWAQTVEEAFLKRGERNKVDVLMYPDQGHSISGPECAEHVVVSILAWILQVVKS